MKKLFILSSLLLWGGLLHAQPWMPKTHGPVKLQDAINNYEKHPLPNGQDDEEEREGKTEKEGKDYLFDRWVWYWRQHLDPNGYMVSPVKTYTEWEAYKKTHGRSSARTASASVDTASWISMGPFSTTSGYEGIGRINVVTFHPTDPNTFYIGSAGGGAWKTTDNGVTWAPCYTNLPTLGVSDIRINPLNANTVYLCTGDADGYDNYSMGIIKSTDGGVTWNNTGLLWTPTDYYYARSLQINPLDTNELTLATNGGIYKSGDGGATWTVVYSGDFEQVLYNPSDTMIMYATDYESVSSQILRSADGGFTWTTVTSLTDAERINLAVTPADPTVVRAIAANPSSGLEGIYSSTDEGATFTPTFLDTGSCTNNLLGYDLGLPTTSCSGQGWYDLCIAMDPTNPNNVIVGGVNNYYSTDGGVTWSIVSQWYAGLPGIATVHADKHWLAYNQVNDALYQGCDGGVYETLDPTSTLWNDLTNGMSITEFYRNAVAIGDSFCIGGAQDVGTKMVYSGGNADLAGGDGMVCQIDYVTPATTWYTSGPGGYFQITNDGGATYNSIVSGIPGGTAGDWVTPLIIHPTNNEILLMGYGTLYISYDQGTTWTASSPAFSSNINNIVVPYTNGEYIYMATDDNVLHFSADFGTTWSVIAMPFSANISRLAADPKNENILWISFNGYGTRKVASYNRTTSSWTSHDGSLPDIPVNCIIIDSSNSTKYIGTDVAVYYMDTTMTDWALYNNGLPSVMIDDINLNYGNNELWAATFGRGMWRTQRLVDTTATTDTVNAVAQLNKPADNLIGILPNPNHGSFTVHTDNTKLMSQAVNVYLLDASGKKVWQEMKTAFDNSGNIHVDAANILKGTYTCVVSNRLASGRSKVVVN